MVENHLYDEQKIYTFKSEDAKIQYENKNNIERLSTEIFVESIPGWKSKKDSLVVKSCTADESIDQIKCIECLLPAMNAFEKHYPIELAFNNITLFKYTGEKPSLVNNHGVKKGYQGILILDKSDGDLDFKFILPYGNFFSYNEDITVRASDLKKGSLVEGDVIIFPSFLTHIYPPPGKSRYITFDIVSHS